MTDLGPIFSDFVLRPYVITKYFFLLTLHTEERNTASFNPGDYVTCALAMSSRVVSCQSTSLV